MVIDIVDKLIGHLLDFWKLRQDNRQAAFENSVGIIFSEFEAIHAGYLENFHEYRTSLLDENCDLSRLIAQIYEERTFSQSSRSKLRELIKALNDAENHELENFYELILSYLAVSHDANQDMDQLWYRAFTHLLSSIVGKPLPGSSDFESDWQLIGSIPMLRHLNEKRFDSYLADVKVSKNLVAIHVLDVLVESMQARYSQVCKEYARLRVKFLK